MEFFHTMNKRPGFTKLLGVVRDHQSTVTAFLLEIPAKGRLMKVIDADPNMLTTQRREKWCRQLVQIVKEAHNLNKVIGGLGNHIDPGLAVDHNDDLVLFRASKAFGQRNQSLTGSLPPEYWEKQSSEFTATIESDLYQLGFLLWRIYGNHKFTTRTVLCKAAGCTTPSQVVCQLPHTYPIGLPMPAGVYPSYLRESITACRAEDPERRVAAHMSLHTYFPHVSKPAKRLHESDNYPDAQELHRRYAAMVYCDRCNQSCSEHFFHCWICNCSNFDMCLDRFLRGMHCFNPSHNLQEYRGRDEERFHTSVGLDGRRKVIDL